MQEVFLPAPLSADPRSAAKGLSASEWVRNRDELLRQLANDERAPVFVCERCRRVFVDDQRGQSAVYTTAPGVILRGFGQVISCWECRGRLESLDTIRGELPDGRQFMTSGGPAHLRSARALIAWAESLREDLEQGRATPDQVVAALREKPELSGLVAWLERRPVTVGLALGVLTLLLGTLALISSREADRSPTITPEEVVQIVDQLENQREDGIVLQPASPVSPQLIGEQRYAETPVDPEVDQGHDPDVASDQGLADDGGSDDDGPRPQDR